VRFLDYDGLKKAGITHSRIHLGRLEREGRFPRRVLLGRNRVAWIEDEVSAWMAERAAARDNPAGAHRLAGRSPNAGKGRPRSPKPAAATDSTTTPES